jgi:hypothetical protein
MFEFSTRLLRAQLCSRPRCVVRLCLRQRPRGSRMGWLADGPITAQSPPTPLHESTILAQLSCALVQAVATKIIQTSVLSFKLSPGRVSKPRCSHSIVSIVIAQLHLNTMATMGLIHMPSMELNHGLPTEEYSERNGPGLRDGPDFQVRNRQS